MNALLQNTAPLPPALRALALGLLIERGMTTLAGGSRDEPPPLVGLDQGDADGEGPLWQALRSKCGEIAALVLRADDPGEAAEYVLGYLPKHFEYVFEQLFGPKRRPVLRDSEAWSRVAGGDDEHEADWA
jgi:hypothetical protein